MQTEGRRPEAFGGIMANHRKHSTRARTETAALASRRLAPHRTSPAVVAPTALATLDKPRASAHADLVNRTADFASAAAPDVPFSRSGWGSVSKGQSAATVPVRGMTSDSLVLVTLQSVPARVYVHGAVPAQGEFTVHLSKKAPRATRFAWYVLD
jgi:hypothetical protein